MLKYDGMVMSIGGDNNVERSFKTVLVLDLSLQDQCLQQIAPRSVLSVSTQMLMEGFIPRKKQAFRVFLVI